MSKWTQQTYVMLADVINQARTGDRDKDAQLDQVARALTLRFAQDNPAFNRARFLAAAGVAS